MGAGSVVRAAEGHQVVARPNSAPRASLLRVVAAVLLTAGAIAGARADTIELTNGKKYEGRVIERTADGITFKATVGAGSMTYTFAVSEVKSLVADGKRPTPVSKEPTAAPTAKPALFTKEPPVSPAPTAKPTPAPATSPSSGNTRTKAEVDALIDQAGKTQPDWWDSVQLNYPNTLDLTWAKPTPPYNPNKWLGQYLWGVINPNPGRHKEGIKLLHHVLEVNKSDPAKQAQTMQELGSKYARYLNDWARAAYWWRKAGDEGDYDTAMGLAECYWKLGCKSMAVETLSNTGFLSSEIARLWSEFGEPEKGLKAAEDLAKSAPHEAWYVSGDISRAVGRYKEAMAFYQKVLALPADKKAQRYIKRAQACLDAIKVFDALDLAKIADGTYEGASLGYRGDVKTAVTVKAGKIESVKVVNHKEDMYFYNMCDPALLRSIVGKQGLKGVDTITGATVSSEAVINGAAKALAAGLK
jgi:uncharacterized protein with FMN-binding domain